MALIPLLFEDNFWAPNYPRRVANNLVENLISPLAVAEALLTHPEHSRFPEYLRNNREMRNLNSVLQQQPRSSVTIDKDKFQANFDVQHFKPEEITVEVTGGNSITIEAKHKEKQDEHGQVYRHFIRKYVLPKNCDIGRLESRLSSDGVLTITAPTIGEKAEHRAIPIMQTGKPARSIEEKKYAAAQPDK